MLQLRVNHYGGTASFVVGGAFALGWSPCIGPILATILGLAAVRESVGEGALLLSVYSAGLAVPFLLAGWAVPLLLQLRQGPDLAGRQRPRLLLGRRRRV